MGDKHQDIKVYRRSMEFHSKKVNAVLGQLTENPNAESETPPPRERAFLGFRWRDSDFIPPKVFTKKHLPQSHQIGQKLIMEKFNLYHLI